MKQTMKNKKLLCTFDRKKFDRLVVSRLPGTIAEYLLLPSSMSAEFCIVREDFLQIGIQTSAFNITESKMIHMYSC